MSLGSTAGFYYDRGIEDEALQQLLGRGRQPADRGGQRVHQRLLGNQYGNNLGQADTPDNAAVASPSTSYSALSVASVNNAAGPSSAYFKSAARMPRSEDRIPFSRGRQRQSTACEPAASID